MSLKFCIPHSAFRIPFLLPFLACPIVLIWTVQNDPFFWDTVQLASKHAHYFYGNGLQWAPLPPAIDSGHPPVFGYYLALIWTFFGKTLPASHWAMLPFLLAIVLLLYRLGHRLGGQRWVFWLLPLVLLDPVLAGQMTLVSPDVVLACFFLLAIEAIWGQKPALLALAILGLCAISMRGMMTAGALFTMRIAEYGMRNFLIRKNPVLFSGQSIPYSTFRIPHSAFRIPYSFLPGFLFAAWFLWWHQQATGWTGYHPGSSWAPAFERVQGWGWLKNLLVVAWRWLDFGRLFEWLIVIYLLWNFWPRKIKLPGFQAMTSGYALPLLLTCLLLLLSPSAILYHNLSAHRYFLSGFLVLHLLVFQWIVHSEWKDRTKSWLLVALIAGMATGNLWIYPRGISMDWDSTLAHQPYHRLRADALAFLEKEGADFATVGSAFPNLNTGENLLLNGDERRFAELDWQRNSYIFASNVFNDFSAADYDRLHHDWEPVYRQAHGGVGVEIYRRR
ncbi:MAG: hypothetical protein ABIQ93_14130 [Saprospiraceae bacterium]